MISVSLQAAACRPRTIAVAAVVLLSGCGADDSPGRTRDRTRPAPLRDRAERDAGEVGSPGAAAKASAPRTSTVATGVATAVPGTASPAEPYIEVVDATTFRTDHDTLVLLLLEALAGDLAVRPAPGKGGAGFTLGPLRASSVAGRLGLAEGDVVRSIAGVPIAGVANLREAYEVVRRERSAVVAIERRGVRLELKYLLAPAIRPGSTSGDLPGPAGRADDELTALFDAGIRKIDDRTYEIDRAVVDRLKGDSMAVITSARIVPHYTDGAPDGFKLFGLRPRSLLHRLGLMNGDVVKTVAGKRIDGPAAALEAFAAVGKAKEITVAMERRGTSVEMLYRIK